MCAIQYLDEGCDNATNKQGWLHVAELISHLYSRSQWQTVDQVEKALFIAKQPITTISPSLKLKLLPEKHVN